MKEIQLEERGFFWTLDEAEAEGEVPSTAVPGLLKIDSEGSIRLELDGIFFNSGHPWQVILGDKQDALRGQIIFGVLKKGNQYTRLSGLLRNGGSARSRGISYVSYIAENCLIAGGPFHVESHGDNIRELEVDLAGLEQWVGQGNLQPKQTRRSTSVKHITSKPKRYRVADGALEVRSEIFSPTLPQLVQHSIELKTLYSIAWIPRKPIALTEAIERYKVLQDLLILLTGSDRTLEWPSVTFGKNKRRATVYFYRLGGKAEPPDLHNLFTRFDDVERRFGELYERFIRMREALGPGIYLYLATRRGMTFYVEHRFASLIWGMESLHRRSKPSKRTALDEKISRILDDITLAKDKRWLAQRLAHAGEPSLEERLFELFSALLLPLDVEKNRVQIFAKRCADVRNLISHFGGRRDANSGSLTMEAQELAEVLGFIYHLLLLKELDIESDHLRSLLYQALSSFRGRYWCRQVGLLPPEQD